MRHPGADHGRSGPHLSCREAALSQYSTIKYTCISSLFCPFLRPLVLPIIPRSELARAHFLQRKAEFTRSHPSSPTLMFEESRSTRERKRDLSISGRPKQFLERNTKTENDTSEKLSFGRNQLIDHTISVLAKTVSFGRNSLFWPKQYRLAKMISIWLYTGQG